MAAINEKQGTRALVAYRRTDHDTERAISPDHATHTQVWWTQVMAANELVEHVFLETEAEVDQYEV